MVANDIKQRIVLEGEREYRQALQNAQRNLRTLRSELKADTAELGANATAQQKNELRTKSLRKQIEEQEKIVRTYREALEEVRAKYGDNEEAVSKWEIKLNDARTALANMRNQIDSTGRSFSSIESGAKRTVLENTALAASFEKISEAASSVASTIESVFSGVVGTISSAIGAVWGELLDIAAKSDNYLDLASYLGASATEVQKWDRAMRAAHGDLSAITGLVSRLKYGGKDNSFAEWFGISGENYSNDLLYAEAVISRMVEMKDEMVANGTWDEAMSDIFGARKTQEIDSILSDWDEILRNLREFDVDNGGVGLTEDELQTMNELYAQVGLLQEKWNAFKESVATRIFGKIALDITSNFQGALDALIAFMDADTQEEKNKAIEDFQNHITEAFTKIGEAIGAAGEALNEAGKGLQGSENGYVKLLGDLLTTVGSVLTWLADPNNVQLVEDAFIALFAIWGTSKAISFVNTLKSVSGYITNIFKSRTAPNINFGTNGTGTGTGTGTDAGIQNIATQNVTTGNVTTMYVANMVGGNGTTPGPVTGGGGDGGTGTDTTTHLGDGGGSGYFLIPGGGMGAPQYGLQSGGNTTLNLNGDTTLHLGDGSDVEVTPLDTGIGTDTGATTPTGSGDPYVIPDISIGPGTEWLDAGGAGAGIVASAVAKGLKKNRSVINYYDELLEKYGLDMDDPEIWEEVHRIIDPSDARKLFQLTWEDVPADIEQQFAAIAEKYGSSETGHFSVSSNRTLAEIGSWVMEQAEKGARETLRKVEAGTWEDPPEIDYHSEPDYDYGYYGDDWSISDIINDLGIDIGGMNTLLDGIRASVVNSDWWTRNTGDGENEWKGLPGQMQAAVQRGVSDIQVSLDGYKVGTLVAPYVSQQIARDMA